MALRCPFYLFRHIQTSYFTTKKALSGGFRPKHSLEVGVKTFLASVTNQQNKLNKYKEIWTKIQEKENKKSYEGRPRFKDSVDAH